VPATSAGMTRWQISRFLPVNQPKSRIPAEIPAWFPCSRAHELLDKPGLSRVFLAEDIHRFRAPVSRRPAARRSSVQHRQAPAPEAN
jgi:hypothetical protein